MIYSRFLPFNVEKFTGSSIIPRASKLTNIPEDESSTKIIKHAKKLLLFNEENRGSKDIEIVYLTLTMGSYEAKVCVLQ
jgi:hypothetical protein